MSAEWAHDAVDAQLASSGSDAAPPLPPLYSVDSIEDAIGLPGVAPFPEPEGVRRPTSITWHKLLVGDVLALTVAELVALGTYTQLGPEHARQFRHDLAVISLFPVCQLLSVSLSRAYRQGSRRLQPSSFGDLWSIISAVVVGTSAAITASAWVLHLTGWRSPDPRVLAVVVAAALILTPIARSITYHVCRTHRPTRVLIVGSGLIAERVRSYLAQDRGATVVGFVDDDPAPPGRSLGSTADLPALCRRLGVDRVLVSFSRTHPSDLTEALRQLHGVVPIAIVPRYFELLTWRSRVDDLCGLPIIDIAPPSLSRTDRFVKRLFDLTVSALLLALLWPLLLVLALAVKVSSTGPAFFRQERVGRLGRPFFMYKFRSMYEDAEQVQERLRDDNEVDGPLFKIREDPRVTAVGRFLRRTSLDELPQLINVLMGHMSLVGPRPFVPVESEQIEGWAKRRFETRPGLTGLWQVSGRNDLSYDDLRRLDYLYVASWSLAWDLKILWQTPRSVVRGEGAY